MEAHDPEITRLLEQVMDESTVGDPMSPPKGTVGRPIRFRNTWRVMAIPSAKTPYSDAYENETLDS